MRNAILLDGAFVTKRFRATAKRDASADDIVQICDRIRSAPLLDDLVLLRIYWYDAPPATETVEHPVSGQRQQLAKTRVHQWAKELHDELELRPDFALRMGEVSVQRVWTIDAADLKAIAAGAPLDPDCFRPKIEQKGVDLRIGLDIARLALRGLVSVIVVVTGDSDMVPAFRFARREGLRVYLDTLGFPAAKRNLKAHADRVLSTPLVALPAACRSRTTAAPGCLLL